MTQTRPPATPTGLPRHLIHPDFHPLGSLAGYAWAAGGVGSATALFWVLHAFLDPWQASLLYLPLVIACATRFGFGPAVAGAFLSFMCWDYFFLPPIYHLTIFSRRDSLLLIIFLVAAITTARLGSRVRTQAWEAEAQAWEAEARERETALLHEASQAISREVAADRLLPTLVQQVVQMCQASWCVVLTGPPGHAPDHKQWKIAAMAESGLMTSQDQRLLHLALDKPGTEPEGLPRPLALPLEVDGEPVGLMQVGAKPEGEAFTPQEERLLLTLANHAAVIIARARLADEAQQQTRQAAILEERNRLAQEVHDTLSHTFTGIKFLLEAADRLGSSNQASECIVQARQMAIEGAQEARRSVWALRPAPLEEAGSLAEALQGLISRQTAGSALTVRVVITGSSQTLPHLIEENLLRICQEALTNVLRHAKATEAEVTLMTAADAVRLTVKDNGTGFDEADRQKKTGFGLISLRERSERMGGTLCIQSGPQLGTRIEIVVPLGES